jgi:type IV secretion system protein VirB10
MSDADPGDRHVQGERDTILGPRASAQSRVGNALAIGLMSALGLGSLVWYYASAMIRTGRAKEHAQAAAAQRAQGDLPLPSLGRIGAPPLPDTFDPVSPAGGAAPVARTLAEIPLAPTAAEMAGAPPPKTPEQLAQERELSGSVFSARDAPPSPAPAAPMPTLADALPPGGAHGDDLGSLLRPSATSSVRARMLPAQRLLMPKGAFIDCTLESAIDSSLPGMTTCITATDTFGVDGKVVLMERGTKLTGETRGQVQQGASRIFVLWTEARTPAGVIVPLDSPGADALGRSGLPGEVDRHFWQRFGAAILVSVIDGAVQAAAQSPRGESGAVIVNPSASQDVLTEILKNTISIPPTVVKKNGDRIQVLVARDLDFRPVYELRSRESAR